jgi:diguanylate cyclase (GGDEF)-like protein
MPEKPTPVFLLASPEPALLTAMEPVLLAMGARAQIVLSTEAALAAMIAPDQPSLVLIDINLVSTEHGTDPQIELDRLLTSVRAAGSGSHLPIVLISDTVAPECCSRLDQGVIDDLLLRGDEPRYWWLRLDAVLRMQRRMREFDKLREAATSSVQRDHLTGVYNRETLLAMLFRETDRVQRMKSTLNLVLFDIDDFGHWNSRLGTDACDELLRQVAGRSMRLLRSYDLLGRAGKDEFLVALPGCDAAKAVKLAERLYRGVFCLPFRVAGQSIRLSACFGVAPSHGRSPLVVLREAEQALGNAKVAGPESIQCYSESQQSEAAPVTFVSLATGDDLLAW